jgi:beta-glucanase (GH16 family)
MKRRIEWGAVFFLFFSLISINSSAQSRFKKLVWSDEFDCQGLLPDTNKWNYDVGNGCPKLCGWGNNELQFYTQSRTENARIIDGRLLIEAHRLKGQEHTYTSARLTTKFKGDWKYGRIEIRAKLPKGRGIWPAIWMLPTYPQHGGWPIDGEIDIMENVGYWPDSLFGTVHTQAYNGMRGTQKTKAISLNDLSSSFHNYAVEWDANEIVFLVDQMPYNRFVNDGKGDIETWPFNQPFHLLINVAVGGHWGGKFGVDEQIFPQSMEIEYVRVYQ